MLILCFVHAELTNRDHHAEDLPTTLNNAIASGHVLTIRRDLVLFHQDLLHQITGVVNTANKTVVQHFGHSENHTILC